MLKTSSGLGVFINSGGLSRLLLLRSCGFLREFLAEGFVQLFLGGIGQAVQLVFDVVQHLAVMAGSMALLQFSFNSARKQGTLLQTGE